MKNLGLALASVVLTLLLAEGVVRVFVGPVRPRNVTPVPRALRAPSPYSDLPYLLAPHAEAVQRFWSDPRGYFDAGATLTYRTNSLGWRGPEADPDRPPGVFRILGIGDSITFGTGVREDDLFLARLRRALEAQSPGRYEVWNLGVVGYNTAHEVALLRHVGVGLDPDLVLLFYVLNDAVDVLPREALEALAGLPPSGPRTRSRPSPSWLLDQLRARLENRRVKRRTIELTLAAHRDDSPGWIRVRDALREAKALSIRHDFALALVVFPVLWQLDGDYPFAGIHSRISATARRLGIPVLDLLPAFRGRDAESLWVHPTNQHPNEEAHAIAAEALLRFLRENGDLLAGSTS